ncbi:Retinoic acid receptor RXR-alpha-A [Bagarius yarrelli]|uniref:Retinoic acid receptor RXR n=1 Tax=Bagarius yarrelli TaxID=175774 RepID=A0A556V396_BAGYA|nr:Retinoic acid receptor RXR-alpha-A [Bagarius yarrelli]
MSPCSQLLYGITLCCPPLLLLLLLLPLFITQAYALQCYACNIQGQRYADVGCSSPEIITCSHFDKGFKQRFCIKTESSLDDRLHDKCCLQKLLKEQIKLNSGSYSGIVIVIHVLCFSFSTAAPAFINTSLHMTAPATRGLQEALSFMTVVILKDDPTLTHTPVKFGSLDLHSKLLQNGRILAKGSAKGDCEVQHTVHVNHSQTHMADSSVQLSSSPLNSPTGHCTVGPHPLHPSLLTPSSMISTPGQLHSPINGLTSPFPVISSPMGHPSITGPPSTSMTFGPSLSPQLSSPMTVSSPEDIKPPLGLNGVMKVPAQPTGTSLSLTKHICAICGDRSSAVQEERQRAKEKSEAELELVCCASEDMPVEKILEAELAVEPKSETHLEGSIGVTANSPNDPVTNICQAADKQLFTLVEWAKRIPHFSELPLDDQVILLRAGWNELLIASFSHRSISVKDGILLATGLHVHRNSAHSAGVGAIFDRVLTELVSKMRDMQMDKSELGCLRAIVLFNPDSKGLSNPSEVEALRERVYASLETYCKQKYPDQPGRFAKLLLRLPALRSIGLKCLEHLFFFKLIGDTPIDTFLMEMLEAPHQKT